MIVSRECEESRGDLITCGQCLDVTYTSTRYTEGRHTWANDPPKILISFLVTAEYLCSRLTGDLSLICKAAPIATVQFLIWYTQEQSMQSLLIIMVGHCSPACQPDIA